MSYHSSNIQELESYYTLANKLLEKTARNLTINGNRESDKKRFDELYKVVERIEEDILQLLLKDNEKPTKELLS